MNTSNVSHGNVTWIMYKRKHQHLCYKYILLFFVFNAYDYMFVCCVYLSILYVGIKLLLFVTFWLMH